jgi:hypothetical protein
MFHWLTASGQIYCHLALTTAATVQVTPLPRYTCRIAVGVPLPG